MRAQKNLNTYKVTIPYTESANPKKRFKIEYTIEAADRETAYRKAEKEFFAYTLYNSASWVRVIERESVRVWRIIPDLPQTAQTIDDLAVNLESDDQDLVYNTLKTLGDLEDSAPSSMIIPLLRHSNPDLAALAAETLGKLGESSNLAPLLQHYKPEAHPRLKASILSSIGRLSKADDAIHDILASALGDEDPRVRANAVEVVERHKLPATTRMLVPLLEDEDNRVRANVLKALWSTHDRNALTTVLNDMTRHNNRWMRASAAFVLQHIDVEGRPKMLSELARDPNPEVHSHARRALFKLDDIECLQYWLEHMNTGEVTELVALKIENIGISALEPLLEYKPKDREEKRLVHFLLDRLEQKVFKENGWMSWLKFKRKRLFQSLG